MNYTIHKLSDLKTIDNNQLAKLYVESFKNKMGAVSKDPSELEQIFINSFKPNHYYVCLDGDKIIGMAACSNHLERANTFDRAEIIQLLGSFKGNIALFLINAMLGKPGVKKENEGYIESVATDPDYRGQGIATSLFTYIHSHTPYDRYVLDVIYGNDKAKALYQKLGYNVYHIDKGIALKMMNIKELYLMEYYTADDLEQIS